MGLWRRRRKSALSGIAVAVVGLGAAGWAWRGQVEGYTPGEEVDGLTDQLAAGGGDGLLPPIRLVDATGDVGLDFEHFPGTRSGQLPEDMGSGVACGDVDGDGWTDVFLVNAGRLDEGGARSRLVRARGDGTFEDVTGASGPDLTAVGQAAAFADVDGDGDLDLFVTTYGTCHLFENDGEGRFEDASARAGLRDLEGFWTGIGVADYDRDGALDVYVCGYVAYEPDLAGRGRERQFGVDIPVGINPSAFEPHKNLLLRGRGDGTFEEVASDAGVDDPRGKGLGVLFCDLDGDGWPDLYVANDVSDNVLFRNRGDGTFEDVTAEARVGDYRGAMGLAAADFDADLDLDLFITHWVAQENALYRAHPRGEDGRLVYMDVADRHGLGYVGLRQVGWATGFPDLDGDGVLDLFVVNGSTIPREEATEELTPMRSQLFWQEEAGGRFHDLAEVAGPFWREEHVGRGGACLDVDLDGDDDLLVSLHGEGVRLLRNETGGARNFVRLRLRQGDGNTHAVGARIEAECGGEPRLTVIGTQGSYLSQHAVGEATFGLDDEAWLEVVRVTWPDGAVEEAGPFLGGTLVTWTRGERPRVEALPGLSRVADAERQRAFFRLRSRAGKRRVAGDLEQAAAAYREALALWPGHADALYYLAGCLNGMGREREALGVLEALVAFEPTTSPGWMQLGRLRLQGGDPDLDDMPAARAAFAASHELNGEESGPLEMLGLVELLAGEVEEARGWLEDAARLNPRSVRARYLLGRCAWEAGDADESERWLAEARELARAASGPGGESVSNEGDTKTGGAMVAREVGAEGPLEGWRSVGERDTSAADEYGGE